MSNAPSRPSELPWLTIARFPAALWIMAVHTKLGLASLLSSGKAGELISRVIEHGGLCVAFFFALSGFVLMYVHQSEANFDRRRYFVARVGRVWPIYAVALLLALPIFLQECAEVISHHGTSGGAARIAVRAIAVLTWTQAWSPSTALAWCVTAWSLSCEVFFYAIFPWLMPRLRTMASPALWITVFVCVGVMTGRFVAYRYWPTLQWNFNPLVRLPEFISGIALAVLFKRGFRVSPWALAPALAAVFVSALSTDNSAEVLLLQHLGILATILALASMPDRAPSRFIRTLSDLGLVSYTLYLFHTSLFEYLPKNWWSNPIGWALCSLFVVGISFAAHKWIETPARKWIIRRWGSARPTAPATT